MEKHAFAACMKRNREKSGITFEKLAEKTGITIKKLIEFESGEFERIKASELEKQFVFQRQLCRHLGIME